jgi:DNA-binding helix-hairpin-helix protein with protein kinase domain
MLDHSVLDLFERAFGTKHRPSATEWRTALDAAMKHLTRCKNDTRHSYLAASGKCPWCELIATARLMFFLPSQGKSATPFRPEDLRPLLQKLAGLDLGLAPYSRPRSSAPIRVSLPHGLRGPSRKPPLKPLPLPPVYPPVPLAPPPDPFLTRLCVTGMIAGACTLAVAWPVGIITMAMFAIWWVLLLVTGKRGQERARAELEGAHRSECERMDEEYARRCQPIEAENQRLMAAWQAANAGWVAEERKWQEMSAGVEAQFAQLEAELFARRATSVEQFQRRKKEADGFVSAHHKARQEYERELRQAEADSIKIQLESHLDKFLIRDARLTAITNQRILSLESFGIQTAKDVPMLKSQKVPGIGPVLSMRLFVWRDSLARSFAPKQALPEAERSRIASRYAPVLLPLIQTLHAAVHDLEGIIASNRTCERELLKAIGALADNAAVVEAHLNALNNLSLSRSTP